MQYSRGDKDKLIGPVPFKNSVSALAPLVQQHLPEMFADLKAAENHLTFVHFRNMSMRTNSAGQDYPFKIDADRTMTAPPQPPHTHPS